MYLPDKDYRLEFLVKGRDVHNVITEHLGELKEKVSCDVKQENDDCFRICFKGKAEDIDTTNVLVRNVFEKAFEVFVLQVDELGDAIRERAYPILGKIEQTLRSFVGTCMIDLTDFDWEKHGNIKMISTAEQLPCHPLEATFLEDLVDILTAKYTRRPLNNFVSYEDLMGLCSECDSLQELAAILGKDAKEISLWDEVFSLFFSDEQPLRLDRQLKRRLQRIRNAIMHHRPVRLHYLEELNKISEKLESAIAKSRVKLSRDERQKLGNAIIGFTMDFQASVDRWFEQWASAVSLPLLRTAYEASEHQRRIVNMLRAEATGLDLVEYYRSYLSQYLTSNDHGENDDMDENGEEDLD